jgi:hypothetical protein
MALYGTIKRYNPLIAKDCNHTALERVDVLGKEYVLCVQCGSSCSISNGKFMWSDPQINYDNPKVRKKLSKEDK